jgi:hypothetical protein
MGRVWLALVAVVVMVETVAAVPFWGAKDSLPAGTPPGALKPGEFVWVADDAPRGPMTVIVSLDEQRAYVYRNGVLIGVSSASTGKPGHQTPTGVFTVLQKDATHHSKTYNNAPMPDAERLTWGGVALHAGELPGYPSSHGCVHLPSAFAKRLFDISPMGMTVVIADAQSAPRAVDHPTMLAPIDPTTGADDVAPRLGPDQVERWEPEKAKEGPISIVVSGKDRRAIVLRNGVEIGRARIDVRDPSTPLGTHAFQMAGDGGAKPSWVAVGVPRGAAQPLDPAKLDPMSASRVTLPPTFVEHVKPLLVTGTTLVVTDEPILPDTTGVALDVVNADPPLPKG